jgi:hypothetical protein
VSVGWFVGEEARAGRPYCAYVQSCTSPRKPERRRASVRMAMPVAYVYVSVYVGGKAGEGLCGDGDGGEAESVVRATPSVTRRTDAIWVTVYLGMGCLSWFVLGRVAR